MSLFPCGRCSFPSLHQRPAIARAYASSRCMLESIAAHFPRPIHALPRLLLLLHEGAAALDSREVAKNGGSVASAVTHARCCCCSSSSCCCCWRTSRSILFARSLAHANRGRPGRARSVANRHALRARARHSTSSRLGVHECMMLLPRFVELRTTCMAIIDMYISLGIYSRYIVRIKHCRKILCLYHLLSI